MEGRSTLAPAEDAQSDVLAEDNLAHDSDLGGEDRHTLLTHTVERTAERGSAEGGDGDVDEDEATEGGLVFAGNKLHQTSGPGGGRKLSSARLCGLALYWFARNAWWTAFSVLLLPLQVAPIIRTRTRTRKRTQERPLTD
jgi:hypothetical protein